MSEETSARAGALAQLAKEAARFTHTPAPSTRESSHPVRAIRPVAAAASVSGPDEDPPVPGYVPVAVAPERGNTRPAVPVDGRLHMRMATDTLHALDDLVRDWKRADPVGLRDLERATLVRVGIALLLADVSAHGRRGAVAEAVAAALDPAVRHTTTPMPDPRRWLRDAPTPVPSTAFAVAPRVAGPAVGGAFGAPQAD